MNSITLYGKITATPLYKGEGRTRTLDFMVAVTRPSRRPGGSGVDFIPVRCWNLLADELKDVEYGDRVIVSGRLQTNQGGAFNVSAHDAWLPEYEDGRKPTPKRPSGAARKKG